MSDRPEIETTASTVVYRNRWISVREDTIVRADGSPGLYSVVDKPDFAVIAAVQDGHIHLVEQYRYPVGRRFWELPQGSWEAGAPDPVALARAELREETGLSAGVMRHAGRLYGSYGLTSQAFDLFFATELSPGERALDPEEQGLITRAFTLAEFEAMVCDGVIVDAATVAALGLLRLKGWL